MARIDYEFLKLPLAQKDLEAINVLLREYNTSAPRDRIERIITNDYIAVARNIDGVIIGMAELVVYEKMTTGETGLIEDVVVYEQYRNRHIGRTLMRMVEKKALEKNSAYYFFSSSPARAAAHHLYRNVLGIREWTTALFRKNFR